MAKLNDWPSPNSIPLLAWASLTSSPYILFLSDLEALINMRVPMSCPAMRNTSTNTTSGFGFWLPASSVDARARYKAGFALAQHATDWCSSSTCASSSKQDYHTDSDGWLREELPNDTFGHHVTSCGTHPSVSKDSKTRNSLG